MPLSIPTIRTLAIRANVTNMLVIAIIISFCQRSPFAPKVTHIRLVRVPHCAAEFEFDTLIL